jgi:hypothetical protein
MSEAILTMYPDPARVKRISRERREAASIVRQGARLGSKVNRCESALNPVSCDVPKMLSGTSQNGVWVGLRACHSRSEGFGPTGEKPAPNLPSARTQNTISPYLRPNWAGEPQGTLLEVRVWDVGKSERRVVTTRIGVEGNQHHSARKGADFRLVSLRERICRTLIRRTGK